MKSCCICNEYTKLDNHHIQSICYNGPNIDWNRCKLCPNCHRRVHIGRIVIEGWFISTNKSGRTLVWRRSFEESITGIQDPKVWIY